MALSTTRAMLERVGFLCYLAMLVGSCGLVGLGLIFATLLYEPRPVLCGAAGLLIAAVLREHGYRHWHFREWEDSFEPSDGGQALAFDGTDLEGAAELHRLLHQLSTLNASGSRDVWTVQELRLQARALVVRHPALREACAEALAQHPEIG